MMRPIRIETSNTSNIEHTNYHWPQPARTTKPPRPIPMTPTTIAPTTIAPIT